MKSIVYIPLFLAPSLGSAATTAPVPAFATQEEKIKESFAPTYGVYKQSQYSGKVSVVKWNSTEGIKRFERTKFKQDFYRLAHHFKPQYNQFNAGQASATIVLSSIYEMNNKQFPLVKATALPVGGNVYSFEYRLWNETNFFNDKTDKILHRDSISFARPRENGKFGGGIDMDQLQKMLQMHGVRSTIFYAEKHNAEVLAEFRKLIKKTVNSEKQFLILNHDNSYKSLIAGNYSCVAGYDEQSDSVLLLDTAAHKGPWTWVNVSEIHHAMNTRNYADTHYRGYMLINTQMK